MIKLVRVEGRVCVLAYCDACRRRITDASRAVYAWGKWQVPTSSEEGVEIAPEGGTFATLHKGHCHDAWAAALGSEARWDELGYLPIFLGNGLHVDWQRNQRVVQMLAEFSA